jgi:CheY-like chemotaxis protein
VHELATNAAKYGALSVLQGEVAIGWTLDESGLRLVWIERGGPRTESPTTTGFGTSMIAASVRSHLSGDVAFDWRPEGLVCSIDLPLSCVVQAQETLRGIDRPVRAAQEPSGSLERRRVLLVEDEPLVGMMMKDILANLGLDVTGPVASLSAAMAFADQEFDAAVLDVNLDGELVYPLAEPLTSRGARLIFVTGYEPASISAPYRGWPVLQKPIEPELLKEALRNAFENGGRRAHG